MGEQNANEFSSPSSSSPSPQSGDVTPTPIDSIPSKMVNDPKESESTNDFTSPRETPTPSSYAFTSPPPFPNQFKMKKAQSHVDKIRKTFSQV